MLLVPSGKHHRELQAPSSLRLVSEIERHGDLLVGTPKLVDEAVLPRANQPVAAHHLRVKHLDEKLVPTWVNTAVLKVHHRAVLQRIPLRIATTVVVRFALLAHARGQERHLHVRILLSKSLNVAKLAPFVRPYTKHAFNRICALSLEQPCGMLPASGDAPTSRLYAHRRKLELGGVGHRSGLCVIRVEGNRELQAPSSLR